MKVLIIGTDSNRSGASLSMVVLAREAQNNGIEVQIVIPKSGPLEDVLKQEHIKYYIVKSYNWTYSSTSIMKKTVKRWIKSVVNWCADRKIMKIIEEYNPDIIHINTICSGVGARPALKKHKKLIWHIREFVEEDHGFTFWNKKQSYRMISKADLLIAISESVYEKFSKIFGDNKIKKIYNGIDTKQFYYPDAHIFQKSNAINIFMGGSIAESKGQYLLIEAINYIKNHRGNTPKLNVHIIGNGIPDYIKELKDRIRSYALEDSIFFDGFKSDMHNQWRLADIAVVASRAEAFGRVTVEAMLSGALVIGADTAGTAEIITNLKTGILFKSGDCKSLADAILYAIDHREDMLKLAAEGQEMARTKFTSEQNAQEIIKAYMKI